MSIIKLRAKVRLTSEENMEIESKYDMGNIAKSAQWVWADMAIDADEIYKIISFNKAKSIVITHDEEMILVNEPFDDLFNRWDGLTKKESVKDQIKEAMEEIEKEDQDDDDDGGEIA